MYYAVRAESRVTAELTGELFALARGAGDPALLVPAHLALLEDHCVKRGDFAAARTHLERGLALYDPRQHRGHAFRHAHDPGVVLRGCGAWALHLLGYPEQARASSREAVARARAQAAPYTLAWALANAAWADLLRRDPPAARARAGELEVLATEQGFASLVASVTLIRGVALAAQGRGAGGVAPLRQGWAAFRATGARVTTTWVLAALAEALGQAGQAEEGLTAAAEGLAFARDQGEHFYEAELHRLQGELLLLRPAARAAGQSEAEACFRRALDLARRQQAKSWELRAVLSLSRLYQRQGRPGAARPLLAETYGWFTEGFDTRDLQEAKALLEALTAAPR
jgi:predicted ATPase